jgi:hypothetical protein
MQRIHQAVERVLDWDAVHDKRDRSAKTADVKLGLGAAWRNAVV